MGYWKDQLLKQQEQGWSSVDSGRVVCAKCFEDYAIQDFIRASASERKCSYCGRRSKKPIAVPMNDVLELIGEGLGCEYADPAEQNPWDEGEYVFPTMDSRELFDEIGPIAQNDDVHEEIVKAFSDRMWNEKDLFGLWEGDALRYGWKYFVKAVKYQRRYVFLRPKKKGPSDSEVPTPDKMLDRIGQVINEVELVRTMDAGTRWFRARVHSPAEKYTSAADLGTVPRKASRSSSNRMSPAGIPMFYGAEDEATAIAETYAPNSGVPATVTVAKFLTARDAYVVDLTALPVFPSLFDDGRRHLRAPVSFLLSFVKDLAKPIKKGRALIEYVPTQIVTEYLRHIFRTEAGHRVRGVIYQSARNGGGKCCVLFVRNKQCCNAKPGWQQDEETDRVLKKRKKYWLGLIGKPTRHDYP